MIGKLPEQKEDYVVRVVLAKRTTGTLAGDYEEPILVEELKSFSPEHKDLAESMFNLVVGVGKTTYECTELVFSAIKKEEQE